MEEPLDNGHRTWTLFLGGLLPISVGFATFYGVIQISVGLHWNDDVLRLILSSTYSIVVGLELYKLVRIDLKTGGRQAIAAAIVILSTSAAILHYIIATLAFFDVNYLAYVLSIVMPLIALIIIGSLIVKSRPGLAVGFLGVDFLLPVIWSDLFISENGRFGFCRWATFVWLIVHEVSVANTICLPLVIFFEDTSRLLRSWRPFAVAVGISMVAIALLGSLGVFAEDVVVDCRGPLLFPFYIFPNGL